MAEPSHTQDSPLGSAPDSPTSAQPGRTFGRTYGRRKNVSTTSTTDRKRDTSSNHSVNTPTYNPGPALRATTLIDADDVVPRKHAAITGDGLHADADIDAESSGGSPEKKFTFGWKAKLDALDNEDSDADDAVAQRAHVTENTDASEGHASPPAPSLSSHKAAVRDDVFFSSLSTLPDSSQPVASSPACAPSPTQSQEESPFRSAVKSVRTKRRAVVVNSDEEDSTLLPTPALTNGPSSPDPSPLSDLEQLGPEMSKRKARSHLKEKAVPEAKFREKGKARAKEPDVFGGVMHYDAPSRQESERPTEPETRATSKRKSKLKALSKKEQLEAQKESARILAQRSAPGLPRPNPSSRPTLQDFFQKIRDPKARSVAADLSSDPIQPASSPLKPDDSFGPATLLEDTKKLPGLAHVLAASTALPLLQARASTSSILGKVAQSGVLDPSDSDESPSVPNDLSKQRAKHEAATRFRQLQQQKQRALAAQHQTTSPSAAADDDDDLEIVQDNPKSVPREEAKARQPMPNAAGVRKIGEARKKQLQFATGRATVDLTRRPASLHRGSDPAALLAPAAGFTEPGQTVKRKGAQEGITDKKQLDRILLGRAEEESQKEIRKKEQAWMERGGRIKVPAPLPKAVDAAEPIAPVWQQWVEKGLKTAQKLDHEMDDDGEEGSDGEYKPDEDGDGLDENTNHAMDDDDLGYVDARLRGSASPTPEPQPTELSASTDVEDESAEDNELVVPRRKRPQTVRRTVANSDDENEGGENENDENAADENVQPVRRQPTWGNVLVPETSLTQEAFLAHGIERPPLRRALSTLAMPEQEENLETSTDKENDAALRSPNSENKDPSGRSPSASRMRGPLADSRRRLSWSEGEASRPTSPMTRGEMRTPLGDITSPKSAGDDENLFSPARSRKGKTNGNDFLSRLKSLSPNKDDVDPPRSIALSLSPAFGGKLGAPLSQFMDDDENDENEVTKVRTLKAGFDGFDEFSQEVGSSIGKGKSGLDALRNASDNLSLTFDGGLEPAIELSSTARRKADEIFHEDQGEILEDAMRPPPPAEPQVWLNTQGYLTQTARSQAPYRPPSPSSATTYAPTQPQISPTVEAGGRSLHTRQPLGTLSLTDPTDKSPPQPLRRIRRARTPSDDSAESSRSASPSPMRPATRDAFAALKQGAARAETRARRKLGKSEFVEQEADESDEEAAFGFRTLKKGEEGEEDEDGEDQDRNLEELVDDAQMDEETQAAQLVVEKYKEHQEADDQAVEKVVQDAVHGRLRTKKRDRGLGFEDEESESEDENHMRRARLPKKRRIEGDTLDAYRQSEEMTAFVNIYDEAIADDGDELSFLHKEDVEMVDQDGNGDRAVEEDEEGEPLETFNAEEVRQQLRAIAEGEQDYKAFNPHNVAFVDGDDSDDEPSVRFKEVSRATKRPVRTAEPDALYQSKQPSAREAAQAAAWLKQEGRTRTAGQGRSVAGAAVTGHRVKSGGGSLGGARRSQAEPGASGSAQRPKQASGLSKALSGSRARFR